MKSTIVLTILLLAAFDLVVADKDLSYPPPGVSAPIVDPGKGQENRTTPLTKEEAEYRRNVSNRRHTIIAPGFSADTVEKHQNKAPEPESPRKQNVFDDHTLKIKSGKKSATKVASASSTQGLLWKIERGSLQPSYLFGTKHVDDPRVVAFPCGNWVFFQ